MDRDGSVTYSDAVEVIVRSLPGEFALEQNYPNPFNPSTVITYSIASTSHVTLKVYDQLGREVAVLVDESKDAGLYSVQLDGSKLTSGLYFYTIKAGSFAATKKLILAK